MKKKLIHYGIALLLVIFYVVVLVMSLDTSGVSEAYWQWYLS